MVKLRSIEVPGNPDNSMGLEVHTLSHRFGVQNPNGP